MYKVMIADDEPIVRKAMSTLVDWEKLGCKTAYIASNGCEVMDNIEKVCPDILILDIKMPGQDGISIARWVWERRLPIKIILLTAYADFAYAQSAIKYGVVDYVTKTGAFEGLITAVEKAREELEREKDREKPENLQVLQENYLKSVFDGALYEQSEVEARAAGLGLQMEDGYLIILLHFRMGEEVESGRRKQIHASLLNFFGMVFAEAMIRGLAVGRNMFAIYLKQSDADYIEEISEKCAQITDMMDNFMKLYVYIGVSRRQKGASCLKLAYSEAEEALGKSFLDEKSKINYYSEEKKEGNNYSEEADLKQQELLHLIRRGQTTEALKAFDVLLDQQKCAGETANVIKNSGILIRSQCRKILAEYGKTVYDVTGLQGSLSRRIYECRHVNEYVCIMEKIIRNTADFVSAAVSRKNVLICECEKYIQDNYEKCISVSDVARSIGTSPSYLSRIFRESTGTTVISAINRKKVEKAKEYLSQRDMKIYEIADALGFENTTYFSHFFKKYTGISPKDYK